jgi:hypothetical protein
MNKGINTFSSINFNVAPLTQVVLSMRQDSILHICFIQVCLIGETHSKLQGIPFDTVSWNYPTNMIPTAKPCVMLFQPFFQTTLKISVVWVTRCAIYQYNHHGESFLIALQLQAITTEMVVYQVVYHRADPDEFTFKIKCGTGSVKVQARTIMSGDFQLQIPQVRKQKL